jgi:hypothetical protein
LAVGLGGGIAYALGAPSTVTVTTTAQGTSATPTPPTRTRAARSPTFDSVTAYLDSPRPHLRNAINVSTAAAFRSAIAHAKPGKTINVAGNVQISGQFMGFNRVISGGTVNVVFQPGAGFLGDSRNRYAAVHVENSGGWRIWGGTIQNPNGSGLQIYSIPGPFTWTGFKVSNTGDTCVAVYPGHDNGSTPANIKGLTLKGVAGTAKPNLSFDPHKEKGTGIHAWNIADATGGLVSNTTLAMDTVDQATGAAVEVDTGRIGADVKLYARATHVGFAIPGTPWNGDAQVQDAGNVFQLWGASIPRGGSLDLAYAEGNNVQGRILDTGGVSSSANLAHASLDYGRATGPIVQNPNLGKVAYATKGGIKLGDVSPLP